MGGIETMAAAIGADLAARLPRQNKKQREGLALLVATALDVRDVNLMELAAALPRAAERLDMRYQWISRLLANPLIDIDEVMAPFARDVLARASAQAHTLVLIIDQSQVNATHQMVMVSLRVGGRAVPLAWQVKNTQGAIGFAEQRAALDRVAALLPAGVRPVLMGGRFYGSPALIAWCRAQGWDWRLRLKQDLLVFEAGGETTLAACFARGEHLLSSHSRGAPGWMKRLLWCGRQGDWFCLGVSEPVAEFDRRPFEHPLLSPGTVAGQLRSASVLEHVR